MGETIPCRSCNERGGQEKNRGKDSARFCSICKDRCAQKTSLSSLRTFIKLALPFANPHFKNIDFETQVLLAVYCIPSGAAKNPPTHLISEVMCSCLIFAYGVNTCSRECIAQNPFAYASKCTTTVRTFNKISHWAIL